MVLAVEETGVTSTFIGLVKMLFANDEISFGIVALKNNVWRFVGSFAITFFTSCIKPISSIRSASSNTNILICFELAATNINVPTHPPTYTKSIAAI